MFHVQGKTVTLKLKEVTFKVRSRAVSLPLPVSSADALYSAASSSLKSELAASKSPLRLRLMGELKRPSLSVCLAGTICAEWQ